MEEKNNSSPFESLPTRAFVLLRRWMKNGKLSESETVELVEIQKEMPASTFKSEFDSFKNVVETKLDSIKESQNTKLNVFYVDCSDIDCTRCI